MKSVGVRQILSPLLPPLLSSFNTAGHRSALASYTRHHSTTTTTTTPTSTSSMPCVPLPSPPPPPLANSASSSHYSSADSPTPYTVSSSPLLSTSQSLPGLLNGKPYHPSGSYELRDPHNPEKVLHTVASVTVKEVKEVVEAAEKASRSWKTVRTLPFSLFFFRSLLVLFFFSS